MTTELVCPACGCGIARRLPDVGFFDIADWLRGAIRRCAYAEDLDALEHFVYHPRLNGCSNVCLVCEHAAGLFEWEASEATTWPDDNNGHHPDCAYAAARRKLNPRRGELDEWVVDRQIEWQWIHDQNSRWELWRLRRRQWIWRQGLTDPPPDGFRMLAAGTFSACIAAARLLDDARLQ